MEMKQSKQHKTAKSSKKKQCTQEQWTCLILINLAKYNLSDTHFY